LIKLFEKDFNIIHQQQVKWNFLSELKQIRLLKVCFTRQMEKSHLILSLPETNEVFKKESRVGMHMCWKP
jgi:hypothetical protein